MANKTWEDVGSELVNHVPLILLAIVFMAAPQAFNANDFDASELINIGEGASGIGIALAVKAAWDKYKG